MTMDVWYYSTGPDHREGPIDPGALRELDARGRLPAATLVWRDGMDQWQPWSSMRAAVLAEAPAPGAASGTVAETASDVPAEQAAPSYEWRLEQPAQSAAHGVGGAAAATENPYTAPTARLDSSEAPRQGGEVVFAGFWRRVAAVSIDGVITGVASYALLLPLIVVMGLNPAAMADGEAFATGAGVAAIMLYYGGSILIPLIYFAWMHSSRHQATLGKMAVGIKVARGDGQRIGFWRAFGRYFAYMLSSLLLMIGLIMAAFTQRKQALHDMICDTVVTDKWAWTDHPQWQRKGLDGVSIAVLAILGLFFALMLLAVGAAILFAANQ